MSMPLSNFESQFAAIVADDRQSLCGQINFVTVCKELRTRHISKTAIDMIDQFKDQCKTILIAIVQNMRTISASTRARMRGRIPARETKST